VNSREITKMREEELEQFTNFLNLSKTGYTAPLYFIQGTVGSGKTHLIERAFDDVNFGCEEGELDFRHSSIRCSELYSSKLLYEAIINGIQKAIGYEGETKILADNPASMFQVAQTMLDTVQSPIFIILECAHELFASLHDAITVLLRHTKYLSGNKLSLILESRDHLHRLNYPSICPRPVILHLPEYTRAQLQEILMKEKPENASETLYHNYLQVIMGYFYLSTHDVRVLKHITAQHFEAYAKPVYEQDVSENSVILLWKRVDPMFRAARESLFLKADETKRNTTLELPYYSKFLLIAAYLASYNSPKTDKRFFLKNAGKIRKRTKAARGPEIKQKMIGPLTFSIDRLIAIFESVTESYDRGSKLLSQLKTLIKLKLIHSVSAESQILEPKMKCNCSEEFIRKISATVRFELDNYLFDNV